MILWASELVAKFFEEEKLKLAAFDMPHMPTLGDAYEEITKQGIASDFVLPRNSNLTVVKGFVEIAGEMLPQQIDCMLVQGEGKRYGLTSQFVYDVEQVLCIFEVKKTLQKSDYVDAFNHLAQIRQRFSKYFEGKIADGFEPKISQARKAFAQITGTMAPETYSGIFELSHPHGILFYSLVLDENAPVSIVHGYGGYRTEEGLRTVAIDFLEERKNSTPEGYGVPSLPNLVIANDFTLIKANGLPYLAVWEQDEWAAIVSTRHNPAKILLEIIWSKISNFFGVPMPYASSLGSDLEMESLVPLLIAVPVQIGEKAGWWYKSKEYRERKLERVAEASWEPARLEVISLYTSQPSPSRNARRVSAAA